VKIYVIHASWSSPGAPYSRHADLRSEDVEAWHDPALAETRKRELTKADPNKFYSLREIPLKDHCAFKETP
jgi:hypothetical protein